jgi:hypothetical protein
VFTKKTTQPFARLDGPTSRPQASDSLEGPALQVERAIPALCGDNVNQPTAPNPVSSSHQGQRGDIARQVRVKVIVGDKCHAPPEKALRPQF